MSTCRMAGRWAPSPTSSPERQTAEAFGVAGAGPAALLFGPPSHRLAGPPAGLGELGAMALDRGGLEVDGLGDVDPHVGLERAREQHGGHLVGRTGLGKE